MPKKKAPPRRFKFSDPFEETCSNASATLDVKPKILRRVMPSVIAEEIIGVSPMTAPSPTIRWGNHTIPRTKT